jgi:hypothetical protein
MTPIPQPTKREKSAGTLGTHEAPIQFKFSYKTPLKPPSLVTPLQHNLTNALGIQVAALASS